MCVCVTEVFYITHRTFNNAHHGAHGQRNTQNLNDARGTEEMLIDVRCLK